MSSHDPHVAVDFETYYDDEISIKTMGTDAYLRHPKMDVYLVTIFDGDQRYTGRPEEFDWPSLAGRVIVSWNAAFDKLVHDILVEKGIIEHAQFAEWNCAANLAVFMRFPRALKTAIKYAYQAPVSKDYRTDALGRTADEMREAGVWENVVTANVVDAEWTWRFWDDYACRWPEAERRASIMTIAQSLRGLPVDLPKVDASVSTLTQAQQKIAKLMPWPCTPEEGVTSTSELAAACARAQIPVPESTAEDSLAARAWEAKYGGQFPWLANMRRWRKNNITLNRLRVLQSRSNRKTGRFVFAQKYFGAHTGRWTGGSSNGGTEEKGFSTQTFAKEPVEGVDERSHIIASKGRRLIIADASQIEPRCLTWLSGDERKLALIRSGLAVYEVHARETMGWTRSESLKAMAKTDKAAKDLYQLAKIRVLGLGYQCGAPKFKVFAETQYDFLMTLAEAKQQVSDFRSKEQCIVKLWNRLQAEFADAIREPDLYTLADGRQLPCYQIELPSGRCLTYFHPRWARKADVFGQKKSKKKSDAPAPMADEPMNPSQFKMDMAATCDIGSGLKFYYGGLLAENLTQGTARDVFNEMMIRVEDHFSGYADVLFHSHDELILDADPGIDPKEVEEVMSISPDWMLDCPFGAEAEASDFYKK